MGRCIFRILSTAASSGSRGNHHMRAKILTLIVPSTFAFAFAACGGSDEPAKPPPCRAASGEICTIAGSGIEGYGGDDGQALEADLYLPMDLTIAPDGKT